MLVLCPTCRNHYDDSCQTARCADPDGRANHPASAVSPIIEHITMTRRSRGLTDARTTKGPQARQGRVAVPPTHADAVLVQRGTLTSQRPTGGV